MTKQEFKLNMDDPRTFDIFLEKDMSNVKVDIKKVISAYITLGLDCTKSQIIGDKYVKMVEDDKGLPYHFVKQCHSSRNIHLATRIDYMYEKQKLLQTGISDYTRRTIINSSFTLSNYPNSTILKVDVDNHPSPKDWNNKEIIEQGRENALNALSKVIELLGSNPMFIEVSRIGSIHSYFYLDAETTKETLLYIKRYFKENIYESIDTILIKGLLQVPDSPYYMPMKLMNSENITLTPYDHPLDWIDDVHNFTENNKPISYWNFLKKIGYREGKKIPRKKRVAIKDLEIIEYGGLQYE